MLKPPFMEKINNTTKANRSAVSGKIQWIWYCSLLNEEWLLGGEEVSRISHPVHILSTQNSAFVPFCAYKTNLNFSKNSLTLPGLTFPLCSSFLPTILEGQLCYKLTVNDTSSGQGKRNELMLLLDYNDDLSLHVMPTGESNGKPALIIFHVSAWKSETDEGTQNLTRVHRIWRVLNLFDIPWVCNISCDTMWK